ncbi:MAG: DUF1343 domain-containing protein [Bacteriovoracaceae bacterium]|nr:DUF1343 domain-containing protein [Bacteriovoracaceae bacterium]
MSSVLSGIDVLESDPKLQKEFSGNIGLLCHSASVNKDLDHSLQAMLKMFPGQVKKIYGPQHGFVTDVQDNMIETDHTFHPFFKLPVYSLYSETRIPTDEMLEGIDHLFVDLQDVGTRIYTYIYTLTLLLEKCADKDIEIIVLDRPNPINATDIEGNILDENYASFVGRHPIPVRHGLTIGEVAMMHQKYWAKKKTNVRVIQMKNYKRDMSFEDTGLPWVMPSPNLPTVEGCYTFVGTVLFEGTNISEGRGTTRSLEIVGHPKIKPWELEQQLKDMFSENKLEGVKLRPINFMPTFQKHAGVACGGYQIHVTDRSKFKSWHVSQLLCQKFYQVLGADFKYKEDPYEYEFDKNPLDLINGTDKIRHWMEQGGSFEQLIDLEMDGREQYLIQRESILLY